MTGGGGVGDCSEESESKKLQFEHCDVGCGGWRPQPGSFRSKLGHPMKLWGPVRTATPPPSGSPDPGAFSMVQLSISPNYAMRRTVDIEE